MSVLSESWRMPAAGGGRTSRRPAMKMEDLEPKECFCWFARIAAIPHESRNEKQLSDFLVRFAQERGLPVTQDARHNVCIKKPGTKGMEGRAPVILQGHMDMVCVKEDGRDFDFAADPLRLLADGDRLRADGTTLGADNGIAIAYMLALLDSRNIAHPPLEAVMTTEEEVGMGGAAHFDVAQLAGSSFVNLDSEEEGAFCVSCSGGRKIAVTLPAERIPVASIPGHGGYSFLSLALDGLAGGHSGLEIHRQRGNANRLIGRVLARLAEKYDLHLASVSGGSAFNVIPSRAGAVVCIGAAGATVQRELDALRALFANELKAADGTGLRLAATETARTDAVYSRETLRKFLAAATLLPDGVQAMDLNIATQKLVESSCNFAVITSNDAEIAFSCMPRSSLGSKKELLAVQIEAVAELVGATAGNAGDYPAWEYAAHSPLRDVFRRAHRTVFGRDARIEGVHAGLECGIFAEKFKALGRPMDFIALGPAITGAHSPRETLSVSSAARTWKLLQEGLRLLGGG